MKRKSAVTFLKIRGIENTKDNAQQLSNNTKFKMLEKFICLYFLVILFTGFYLFLLFQKKVVIDMA